jgi:formylglycine-generating enzyme required for sulfatase activity
LTAEECTLAPKDIFKECDQCPVMVAVPAGSFTMGSAAGDRDSKPSEYPRHQVTIAKSFAVGQFAVTFDEWDACAADGGCNGYKPSDAYWGRGQRPAIYVSWHDAQAYTTWLSRKTGKRYRLLNEAEREYVTRAGTTSRFWSGSSIPANGVNYNDASQTAGQGAYRAKTLPVDSFRSNPWGLYQVYGNVAEWVEDCWHENYSGAPSDGTAWSGTCSDRVIRGASWWSHSGLGSANRNKAGAGDRTNYIGFRVARSVDL